jgi:RND family efflux transporter MFP subunit
MPSTSCSTLPLLPALLTALFLLAGPGAVSQAADTISPEVIAPAVVTVVQVREQPIPAQAAVAGTLQAAERASIAAKVTGVITRMPVVLGSQVRTGDLLATISAEEIAARLGQAEAQLAQARRNLEREQRLLQKNAATPETVKSMTDLHAIAEAGYREAKTMMGYTAVTAPFDGVVTRKNVNSGDLATPGTVLLELENHRKLQVRVAVPESLILRLHTGDLLAVKVEAANVETKGTVTEIAPAADPGSRTAAVIIDLPPDPNLRSGQFARVFLPGKDANALLVPSSAIVPSGQMDRVFVVEADRARLRLVRTGWNRNGMTEILSGLNPGETVVTGNNRLLIDGQPVRFQP